MVDSQLPRNYTACVQYDKRGQTILCRNTYSMGGSSLFELYPLGTVILKEGLAYGQETYALYDPFELYDSWRERRDGPLPPHLVFANLPNEDAAVVAFLETYGPLTDPIQNKIRSQGCGVLARAICKVRPSSVTEAGSSQRPLVQGRAKGVLEGTAGIRLPLWALGDGEESQAGERTA